MALTSINSSSPDANSHNFLKRNTQNIQNLDLQSSLLPLGSVKVSSIIIIAYNKDVTSAFEWVMTDDLTELANAP